MNILVVGSGLIGLTSALFLQKNGHQVKVIERQADVALETSFANGGQLSASYSEPWSNWGNVRKMMSWIGKEDSPLLFRPKLSSHQFLWGLQFLNECRAINNEKNIKSMMEIALFSRVMMNQLEQEFNIKYQSQKNGIITFYKDPKSFNEAKGAVEVMKKYGCEREIYSYEQCLEIEPAIEKNGLTFAGADYTKLDGSGDARLFCEEIKSACLKLGVEFVFNTELVDFLFDDFEVINKVILKNKEGGFKINGFDKIVLAAGSYTHLLAKKAGIKTNIYPAKGYSATFDIFPDRLNFVNFISLTDSDNKVVFTRLGNQLRVAGTAEFNGYNLDINEKRCNHLKELADKMFPGSLNLDEPNYWCGLRPSTPGNVPIIGQTEVKNLYINSGHGTLGWTMAAASGKMISNIIDGKDKFNNV